jgi:FRG domain
MPIGMKTIMNAPAAAESKRGWAHFLEEINSTCGKIGCVGESDGNEVWFRGHSRSDYELLPSLFRAYQSRDDDKDWTTIWGKESDLFWEFWVRARELHGVIEDDWDVLFAMQHYGTPTGLLEWTEVLGVAVYFATLGVDEANPDGAADTIVRMGLKSLRAKYRFRRCGVRFGRATRDGFNCTEESRMGPSRTGLLYVWRATG